MSSGADLFVVCKQCGSEVSPYITECPYCGGRLRRRAPKLPRAHAPSRPTRGRTGIGALLRRSRGAGRRSRAERASYQGGRWAATRPYATIALVAVSCLAWIVFHAAPQLYEKMAVIGPLHGDWWRLFTCGLAYLKGVYALVTLVAVAIFGWLLERRYGPAAVLAVFFGATVTGALATVAAYPVPFVSGGNGAALALLAAWAAPDLLAARSGSYREGDLLGAGVIAALLLALPFALPRIAVLVGGNSFAVVGSEASWLAGVLGAALGLAVGLGLSRLEEPEA